MAWDEPRIAEVGTTTPWFSHDEQTIRRRREIGDLIAEVFNRDLHTMDTHGIMEAIVHADRIYKERMGSKLPDEFLRQKLQSLSKELKWLNPDARNT